MIAQSNRWMRPSQLFLEVAIVMGFAIWLAWPYLGGVNKQDVPGGGDFVVSIQGRYFWERVKECRACALWNGDLAGGSPALIDTSTDMLHPLAAIPTLLFGVLDGNPFAFALTLAVSGIACWWLAYVLSVGLVGRIFAGGLGVAGGHITGRMDFGLVVLMTSLATASLLIPIVILFARRLDRRTTGLLGGVMGLCAIAGQAYIQVGVVLLAPAILILVANRRTNWKLISRRIAQCTVMAAMIAALLLIPVFHYWNLIDKDFDPNFSRNQPFSLVPLNLIIDSESYFSDPEFFREPGFPGWHINYIGWIALIFALIGVASLWGRSRQETIFLGVLSLGSLWLGSGDLFQWVAGQTWLAPLHETVVQLRTTSNIANLAVPPIIGFAACGVDWCYKGLNRLCHLRIRVGSPQPLGHRKFSIGLGVLVLFPVLLSLNDVTRSSRQWNSFLGPEGNPLPALADSLRSDELRWVNGNVMTVEFAIAGLDSGLKLGNQWRPWRIAPEVKPLPGIWVSNSGPVDDAELVESPPGMEVYVPKGGNPYARLISTDGALANCVATGRGAKIDIVCPAGQSGILTVQERAVDGWSASANGVPLAVVDRDGWISVSLKEGINSVSFRFHSPGLRASLLLTFLGILWALWWIVAPKKHPIRPSRFWNAER